MERLEKERASDVTGPAAPLPTLNTQNQTQTKAASPKGN